MFNFIKDFGKLIDSGIDYFQPAKIDSVNELPQEVMCEIFFHLNNADLKECCLVNKKWKVIASPDTLWNALILKIGFFGKSQWNKYLGDVGEEPSLPKDIYQIFNSPCPFFPGKKVKETHILVLIPKIVDDKPLNLTTLGELVKAPKQGHATKYAFIWKELVNHQDINQAIAKSHWALMTKDIIPESRDKSYPVQAALIARLSEQTGCYYEVPRVLEATTCAFMHYVDSGNRLFTDKSMPKPIKVINQQIFIPFIEALEKTYTHCQEKIQNTQIIVGEFSPSGLHVNRTSGAHRSIGVMAVRRFY